MRNRQINRLILVLD